MDYITTMPRDAQERAGKIRTFTGRYVNPLAMRPEDIDIVDIAHHLSHECRFAGACPQFYSVAQHSVLVARRFISSRMRLAGLLHDAEEAYLKDIPSPVKHDPRMAWYRETGRQLNRMIFVKFGLDPVAEAQVKAADDHQFREEVLSWWGGSPHPIAVWTPTEAKREFLALFEALTSAIRGPA